MVLAVSAGIFISFAFHQKQKVNDWVFLEVSQIRFTSFSALKFLPPANAL